MGENENRGRIADAALARRKISRFHEELRTKNYFEMFGVQGKDFDVSKIRATYKDLAKQWHADAYPGLNLGPEKKLLDEIFAKITEAYETLTDQKLRSEYSIRLQREAKGLATDVSAILRAEQLVDEAIADIRRKRWPQAAEALREAIRLNGDDPLYAVHLGWAIYNQSPRDRAASDRATTDIMNATKRQENLPIAYQYLGQIYFARENYAEAKKWWKKCLDWDAKNIDASRGLRLVAQREEKQKGGFGSFVQKLLKKR